jgi:hypothetical protein
MRVDEVEDGVVNKDENFRLTSPTLPPQGGYMGVGFG